MEKNVKVTKKMVLGALKEYFADKDFEVNNITLENVNAYIDNELTQLEKKAMGRKTDSQKSQTDAEIKELIISALTEKSEMTVSDMLKTQELKEFTYTAGKEQKNLSASKVTSVLGKMQEEKIVKRDYVKGKALFSLAD